MSAAVAFPEHSHDREEILAFLSGAGRVMIGDETGAVSAGDVIVVPAGALHVFDATEDLDAIGVVPAGTKTFAAVDRQAPLVARLVLARLR